MTDADLVFDVGLHRGEDTDYYLRRGFRVIAFEADEGNIAHCKARFPDALRSGQLTIVEGAIAPACKGACVTFYRTPSDTLWGTIDDDFLARAKQWGVAVIKVDVPRVDMHNAFKTYGIPHYLKVDVEGVDKHVLEVLADFPARPAFLSMESEKHDFASLIAEIDLMSGLGYSRFAAVQQAQFHGRTVRTTALDGSSFDYTFDWHPSGPFGNDVAGWMNHQSVLQRYRQIYRMYRLFGDHSVFRKRRLGNRVLDKISRTIGTPLPGWYDTHARLD